ncbi:MAG TPA: hypothetical protein VIL97_03735, partial [Thermoanaerobaculia bacterium]
VGDAFATTVVLQPPIAADVEIRWTLAREGVIDRQIIRGRANRFGFFSSDPIPIRSEGEYRVDLLARGTDDSGEHWIATTTWGNVVERRAEPIVTRGRRGFDNVPRIQDQWFFVRQARAGGDHVMFPFHGGDVMWLEKYDPAADIPKVSVQDPSGSFSSRVLAAASRGARHEAPSLEERIAAGETPLFTTCDGCLLPFDPDRIDQWGYFYGFAERPGVRIREFISEDSSNGGYWRFIDPYHFQIGNGTNGDLPNDFKFHFGGAVWRDAKDGFSFYGAYASLFVLLPLNDVQGGRVFPPFQGNGGGPSGGPLFTLKGKPVDIFFHPTGTRPGSILQLGNLASFSGQIGPTLPSKVEIAITSPSGIVRRFTGQANKVGYFYDPSSDFRVDEPGVWRATVKVWHDGLTSAGQVTAPYPTGGVLGSREGEFYFYVVRPDISQLEIGPMQQVVRPADGPITFTIAPPPGLSNVEMYYTTTMPGFILEQGVTSSLTYTYDAPKLARDFPNLDLHDADGFAGADTITMSFLVTGLDARGQRQYLARQIVVQGEELQMPEQKPSPKRRGARR